MSQKITAAIKGIHGYVPDFVLSNEILSKMVDTNDEWIRERTGIEERRILKGEGLGTSDLAVPAVKALLEKTGTRPEEIDLLICCTVTADFRFPDTGTLICYKAGLVNAFGYDLAAACSGFLFGLHTGAQFVESGNYKKVIVVGADKMSSILDYSDRNTCILFGDGAGAVLLEPTEDQEIGLGKAYLRCDGSGGEELNMLGGGSVHPSTVETVQKGYHNIRQNGRVVFKHAVRGMSSAVNEVLKSSGRKPEDINWVVPHQANIRIIESVAHALDFPMERVMVTIQRYGNTTAATIPLCLRDYEQQLKRGDELILTAFGGGFTWGAIHLVWGYDTH